MCINNLTLGNLFLELQASVQTISRGLRALINRSQVPLASLQGSL